MPVSPGPTLPSDVTEHTLTKGVLESPALWQVSLLVAGVLAYLLFRPRGKRLTPRLPLGSRLLIIGSLCALAGVFWVNEYVGYVRTPHDLAELMQRGTGWLPDAGSGLAAITTPDDQYIAGARSQLNHARTNAPVDDGTLRVEQVGIPDPARGVPVGTANVMLPPGYDNPANRDRRYPVVYLIHGYPAGNSDDWFTAGDAMTTMRALLADHIVQPMIVVAPDMTAEQPATDWECLNVPNGPHLEDYLVKTVVPGIDTRFRTIADRQHRSLGGMSGGAYCALNIGLKHLSSFASLLITLPYDSLGDSAGILAGHPELLPPNTPRDYIPTMAFPHPVSVIIATGMSAPTDVTTSKRLANELAARGQQVALHLEPGLTHTWRAARAALPYLLAYANEVFTRNQGGSTQPVLPRSALPPPLPSVPPVKQRLPVKRTGPIQLPAQADPRPPAHHVARRTSYPE